MKGIYTLGGYPDKDNFLEAVNIVLKNFDFIEIGLPFSDPVADGPVIAKAINEVIGRVKIKEIIDIIEKLETKKDIFIMTYSNVIYSYGIKNFSDKLKKVIKGIIIADLPNVMHSFFYSRGFEVPIIPFVTPESRIGDIIEAVKFNPPFIYFIGVRGITGSSSDLDSNEIKDRVKVIKSNTNTPIIIGFGIKSVSDAKKAVSIADGFVIGTEAVKRQTNIKDYEKFLRSFEGI